MLKPVCDLCRADVLGAIAPNQVVIFCERCQPHAEEYIRGSMEIVQDSQRILERRLENYRKEFLGRAKTPKKLEVIK